MKSVLVTAGFSPLGRAICEKFYSQGYKVYATTTSSTKSDSRFTTIKVDITKESEVKSAFKGIKELDVLVNNAGIYTLSDIASLSLESFSAVVDVNYKGLFLVTRELLPLLKKSEGSIVNISSMNAFHPGFGKTAHYDGIKGAVSSFTSSLAVETKLRVNAIAPGLIYRSELEGSELEKHYKDHSVKEELMKCTELSDAVYFLSTSQGIYGQTLLIDNGYTLY